MPDRAPPRIDSQPLPYVAQLGERAPDDIDLVVIHCTELPDLAMARSYGERVLYDSGSGNSGHFYIDRDGSVYQYVATDRIAHHVRGMNATSIGIELVNTGRYPDWFDSRCQSMQEPYPAAQIASLLVLVRALAARHPSLRHIVGHDALDLEQIPASDDAAITVARKRDPGPLFPWHEVLAGVPLRHAVP